MKLVHSLSLAVSFAIGIATAPNPCHAIPSDLTIGEWTAFQFTGPGSSWTLPGIASIEFQFTTDVPAELQVVDVIQSGDQFHVFNFDQSLGITSAPVLGATTVQYDVALEDLAGRWSRGTYALQPGSYQISGIAVAAPFAGGGTGGLRVVLRSVAGGGNQVPEPATWALLIAVLGFAWQRLASDQGKRY